MRPLKIFLCIALCLMFYTDIQAADASSGEQPGPQSTPESEPAIMPNSEGQPESSSAQKNEPEQSGLEQAIYPGVKNLVFKKGGDGAPSVSINYPSFGNENVDEVVYKFVAGQSEDYEKDIEDATNGEEEKPSNYEMWEMAGFYTIEKPRGDIASVTFNIYSYSGGAHGNLFIRCLNFDLASGKSLQFSDLFGDEEKAISILSEITAAKLRADLGEEADEDMINAGTSADASNFLNLSLTSSGVTVEFQPYQVGPWSIGPQSVAVPIEDLASAKPNGEIWNLEQKRDDKAGH